MCAQSTAATERKTGGAHGFRQRQQQEPEGSESEESEEWVSRAGTLSRLTPWHRLAVAAEKRALLTGPQRKVEVWKES